MLAFTLKLYERIISALIYLLVREVERLLSCVGVLLPSVLKVEISQVGLDIEPSELVSFAHVIHVHFLEGNEKVAQLLVFRLILSTNALSDCNIVAYFWLQTVQTIFEVVPFCESPH